MFEGEDEMDDAVEERGTGKDDGIPKFGVNGELPVPGHSGERGKKSGTPRSRTVGSMSHSSTSSSMTNG